MTLDFKNNFEEIRERCSFFVCLFVFLHSWQAKKVHNSHWSKRDVYILSHQPQVKLHQLTKWMLMMEISPNKESHVIPESAIHFYYCWVHGVSPKDIILCYSMCSLCVKKLWRLTLFYFTYNPMFLFQEKVPCSDLGNSQVLPRQKSINETH